MEIRKNLPETFEEFAEARKNAFMAVKAVKDQDKPVIGIYCTYFPEEMAISMGAAVVGLCSMTDETIPAAEEDLPKNLCPLIKASYGFGKTDKCPYFYFSDLVIAETTCDGKKKMYEQMAKFKPMHIIELPNCQTEDGVQFYRKQIIKMKEKLEEFFGITITEDDIRHGIKVKNAERAAIRSLYSIMKADPAPISGMDLINTLSAVSYNFDRTQTPAKMEALIKQIQDEAQPREKKPRIMVTGCPMGNATFKLIQAIEDAGADVVFYENCTGAKAMELDVDETNEDVYEALARKYTSICCSCMTPNDGRLKMIGDAIDEYKVDGVIDMVLQACHTYAVETKAIDDFCTNEKNTPYLAIETDYSQSDIGQLSTRVAAFVEML